MSGRGLAVAASAVLLAGCDRAPSVPPSPGARLEAAAMAAGIVADPAAVSVTGSWVQDDARLCLLPVGDGWHAGVAVDAGRGQRCLGTGEAERRGTRLRLSLGACRIDATVDGERIGFPGVLPEACAALCRGRATLEGVSFERVGATASEAAAMRAPRGEPLCGG